MSEWRNRTTRLVRDGVKVSVMSYKDNFGNGWRTLFTVHAEDNPVISHIEKEWRDADSHHDKRVHVAELMGYRAFSEAINGKEKAPEAAANAPSTSTLCRLHAT